MAALGLCALAGCGRHQPAPSAPGVPLGQEFTLAPGAFVSIEGTGVSVMFEGVEADSRCPTDVVCVWEGDAVVAVRVASGGEPAARYTLHTARSQPTDAAHGGYRIRLVSLAPAPTSEAPPAAGAYRVTLVVSRS